MLTSIPLIHALRPNLQLIIAIGALAVAGVQTAAAANLEEITVKAPTTKFIGPDATGAIMREETATARVRYNPISLTTNSGRALLDDKVASVARRLCMADAIVANAVDDGSCVQQAIRGAEAQLDAASARVKEQ